MKKQTVIGLIGILASGQAFSMGLVDAYEKALAYDSNLAAAKASYAAAQDNIDLSKSSLFPQINASTSASYNDNNGPFQSLPDKQLSYGITLTQPLFRANTWFQYKASESLSAAEKARYNSAQQQLILDLATAYFNVLRARDTLTTSQAVETAIKRQYKQAKERYDVGLIAITAVYEARASYDDSNSKRIAAENQLDIAKERLARLTGEYPDEINNLRRSFPLSKPSPMTPSDWETIALNQNWQIQSASEQVKAAKNQLSGAKSGHYPTVDLTASASQSITRTVGSTPPGTFQLSPNGTRTDRQIAIQVKVPIYLGGGIQAGVRKQRSEVEVAEQRLNTARRDVRVNTRSLFRTVNTNIESASALKQTIVSRQSALDATRAGYEVGTRNIVDVFNAEQNYYIALRDYANARYDYIINTLSLKQSAGTLSPQDIIDLNNWLSASAPGIEAMAKEAKQAGNEKQPAAQ